MPPNETFCHHWDTKFYSFCLEKTGTISILYSLTKLVHRKVILQPKLYKNGIPRILILNFTVRWMCTCLPLSKCCTYSNVCRLKYERRYCTVMTSDECVCRLYLCKMGFWQVFFQGLRFEFFFQLIWICSMMIRFYTCICKSREMQCQKEHVMYLILSYPGVYQ